MVLWVEASKRERNYQIEVKMCKFLYYIKGFDKNRNCDGRAKETSIFLKNNESLEISLNVFK